MRATSEKVYTNEERFHIISARHCCDKGAEKLPKIEDYGKLHPQTAKAETC